LAISERLASYLDRAGFLRLAQLGFVQTEPALISSLVERWRPKTHTFHMRQGECTIMLQDVAVLLELKVDGHPVIGLTTAN
jgi:copper homeostasis protein CutC